MATAQPVSSILCNRCGNAIAANVTSFDTFYVYCSPCNALMAQEALSWKKKYEQSFEENKVLRSKQDNIDNTIAKFKNKAEAVEKAYTDEAAERLEVRTQRDWARNAIMYWKSFLDHWKVKSTCAFCTTNQPCQTMKLIEEQALSATPEWSCEDCKRKEADCAALKNAVNSWAESDRHESDCSRCEERKNMLRYCDTGHDLYRNLRHHMSTAVSVETGRRFLEKMENTIKDFSFLGEGSGILFDGSTYHIVKLNMRKLHSGEITYLAASDTPRGALVMAKQRQIVETMNHS